MAPGRYGLKQYYAGSEAVVDIIFIHGLTGDREKTWTDDSTATFWPADLLCADIPDSRVFSFGYDADVVHFWAQVSQNRIANHAATLLNSIAQHRERTETEERPILFVAHSLGGLVFEDMLLTARNSAEAHLQKVLECTRGVCFLGTPHCGADLASWANIFGKVVNVVRATNKDIVNLLRPESEVLARIQKEFHTMLRSRSDRDQSLLKITCFYEELPLKSVGEVVPKHSAILPAYTSIGIHANHMDMTKFADADDAGYFSVSSELMRWTREIRRAQAAAIRRDQAFESPSATPAQRHVGSHDTTQGTISGRDWSSHGGPQPAHQTITINNPSGNGRFVTGGVHYGNMYL